MKRRAVTLSLESVKTQLRRVGGGRLRNQGGWGVFVDPRGQSFFIVDEDHDNRPIRFEELRSLAQWQNYSHQKENSLLSS